MRLKIYYILILIVLLFNSCSSLNILKKDNHSVIAISVTSTGFGAKGYGIIITLENIDTHEIFKSKSLSPISPHSIIQNIPSGRYLVKKVEIPVGNIMYSNWSNDIPTFFGLIKIESNSKYYLGNFNGTRSIGNKNIMRLKIEDQEIPDKIKKTIEKENTGWKNGEFIKLYPYKKDILLIY